MTSQRYENNPIFQATLEEVRATRSAGVGQSSRPWRWATRSLNLLLIVAVIAVALIGYGLIDNRWYRIVTIQGGSMSPTLTSGDAIILTRAPDNVEVGMIVTLEVDGQVVTHRVVTTAPNGTFTTKGDANSVADDWGESEVRVIGVHRVRIPLVGKFLTAVASIHKSNAWLADRSMISGAADSSECFGDCAIVEQASEPTERVEDNTGEVPETQLLDDEMVTDPPDSQDSLDP